MTDLKDFGTFLRAMTNHFLDTSGLRCPMPLLKTKLQLNAMQPGEMLEVIATDPGSAEDIPSFLKLTSHSLEKSEESEGRYRFLIRCGN